MYVSENNLHILHFNEHEISVSTSVQEKGDQLRQECMIQLCVWNLQDNLSQGSIVSFLNARSLRLHILDLHVKEDTSIFSSDIIFISVTRLLAEDDDDLFEIQNSLHRNDSSNTNGNRSSYGLAVYLKDTILSKVKKRSSFNWENTGYVSFVHSSTREKGWGEVKMSLKNITNTHTISPNAIALAGDYNIYI